MRHRQVGNQKGSGLQHSEMKFKAATTVKKAGCLSDLSGGCVVTGQDYVVDCGMAHWMIVRE